MADLFAVPTSSDAPGTPAPLADRLRPATLDDIAGQDHLLGEGQPLRKMVEQGRLTSFILWGPPGCGKTTIARIVAAQTGHAADFASAITAGTADLKKFFEQARIRRTKGQRTVLFVDEIHRFNRSQQDSFLPVMEDGTIVLIGATTENPSFELNPALLSRCSVYTLNPLDDAALRRLLDRVEAHTGLPLPVTESARASLLAMADGDGRALLSMCEQIADEPGPLDEKALARLLNRRRPLYDKNSDHHYNLISALHKSVRGSDPDAALYWFARIVEGGENPEFLARRMVRMASEDIGMADPQALAVTIAAWEAVQRLGVPEGELSLAHAVVYLATAPKSNAVYTAYKSAKNAAAAHGSLMPPRHILNAPTKLMKDEGYGEGYRYDHDEPDAFSGQNYFPDGMTRPVFYDPPERGFERDIRKRLEYWKTLRAKKTRR